MATAGGRYYRRTGIRELSAWLDEWSLCVICDIPFSGTRCPKAAVEGRTNGTPGVLLGQWLGATKSAINSTDGTSPSPPIEDEELRPR